MPETFRGKETAESLIGWYWAFGTSRKTSYAVSPQWLRSVYLTRDLLRSIEHGQSQKQTSFGLWGPSQSGKSTLVSQSVDGDATDEGRKGLLDWDCPALFSSRPQRDGAPPLPVETVVFNPHNMGSDASGCVSRFRLVGDDELPYRQYPVEIELLSNAQLMHAISSGYASECKIGPLWTVESVEALLAKVRDVQAVRSGQAAEGMTFSRDAFELLHEVLSVVELLIESRDERFSQLNASESWPSLLSKILDCGSMTSDRALVQQFAARLLWDGQQTLTQLFDDLVSLRNRLPKGRLFCSLGVAATLVNIDSFKIYLQPEADERLPVGAQRIRQVIRNLQFSKSGSDILIASGAKGSPFLPSPEEFGLLQGLVRELVIPLRRKNCSEKLKQSGFVQFLQKAELVDFPGLPNRDRNAQESLLDLTSLASDESHRLLTEVLKRGKVASLVNGYSRTLSLDAFVILARAGRFIPKVEQLHRGLAAWWRFVEPKFDPYSTRLQSPPLPLFFNMTFFAEVIDKVSVGAAATGLMGMADQVSQLNPYVNPTLSTMIATTYPQFRDGEIRAGAQAASAAVEEILSDANFGPYCKLEATKRSLRNVAERKDTDGGVDYLFRVLESRASSSDRQGLLENRYRNAVMDLLNLVQEQAPLQGNAQIQRDVEKVLKAIEGSLIEKSKDEKITDAAAWVSYRIRKYLDVHFEDLEPLPQHGQTPQRYLDYVNRQVQRWCESKSAYSGLTELGLKDPAIRGRLLEVIATTIDRNNLANWIRAELPRDRRYEDNRELRRVFAILMSSNILRNRQSTHPVLDGVSGVIQRVREWAAKEESKDGVWQLETLDTLKASPHYSSVIGPFEKLLGDLASGDFKGREPQPGDEEVVSLFEEAQSLLR